MHFQANSWLRALMSSWTGLLTGNHQPPGSVSLDFDSFHFVEREFLSGAIVKLRRPGRFVISEGLGMFEHATVLQVGGDTGRAEGMATGRVGQGGGVRPPLDHVQHVESGHRLLAEPVALADAAKQRPLLVATDHGCREPGVQIFREGWMAGNFVSLAAFLVQPKPPRWRCWKLPSLRPARSYKPLCRSAPGRVA